MLHRVGRRFSLTTYLGSIYLTTVALTALALWWAACHGLGHWGLAAWGVLLLVCTSQLAVALIQWATMRLVRPRILPRMDFSKGIPAEYRTIVAVPTIITDSQEVDDLLEALEVRFLANRDENLRFALLTDFPDAPAEKMAEDEALLQRARDGIEALNAKYYPVQKKADGDGRMAGAESAHVKDCGYFFLFHRARRWNAQENVWMGWERKRGKLEEFNDALRGETGRFDLIVGPTDRLEGIRYVITLDSDTQLPRDSAWQLAGAMAHPLNRPHYDEKLGRVTEGYGILQPRVGISMPSANRSRFARLFAGEPGIDPYTHAVSDVYQDVFEEGSFIGKGIYDVDVFRRSIGRRLPENRVLSHDLLEGAYARSGLVSDVLLFEEYPWSYPADMSRRYRWIRGDWQIAPWLLPRVPAADLSRVRNPISGLSRWKILDNVRRSLMPGMLLALLIIGWFLPGGALFYTLVVIGILLLPVALNGATELTRRPADLPLIHHARLLAYSITRQVLQQGFALACLPYDALVSLDAIVRTTARLLVTGRGLLQWHTARDAQRTACTHVSGFYASMWILPLTGMLAALALGRFRPDALAVALPVIGLWFVSPAIAFWLSRPARSPRRRLTAEDLDFLGTLSRRTWRFFETFTGPAENYLPPDNFQEDPPQGIAHRTSPTNIGLLLLANLAAYDFGYIPAGDAIERTTRTLATLDKLQRYRGHFLNWYDTRTLQPLRPLYVSTVDSGNLVGHILTLAAGLDELAVGTIARPAILAGFGNTLDLIFEAAKGSGAAAQVKDIARLEKLREDLRTAPRTLSDFQGILGQLAVAAADLASTIPPDADGEMNWWAQALDRQCRLFGDDLNQLAPWVAIVRGAAAGEFDELPDVLRQLDEVPTLVDVARMESTLLPAIDAAIGAAGTKNRLGILRAAVATASETAAKRVSELRQLALRCRELADIDYGFLYDKNRHLLSVGYNVADHRLDVSFYDLLASEARLASFVAIAQGKLPQEHWFSLGRSLTSTGRGMALLSWSGSMFEYLMPLLVMPTYEHTLLDQTYQAVVRRQIEYGRERGVPWGISESGYNKTDAQVNYQYRAFGVPGLGFKRGLANDLVVAPYASVMALMVDPEHACANLRRLAREGRLNGYGFYEAIDYTPARLPRGEESVTVRVFHGPPSGHGAAVAGCICCWTARCSGASNRIRSFRATDLLLQERDPQGAVRLPASGGGFPRVARFGGNGGEIPRLHHSQTSRAGSASAFQRPLSRCGDGGRRRVQPLARSGRDALARRFHARLLGHVLLSARSGQRRILVRGPAADDQAASDPTRPSIRRAGRSSGGATGTSTRISKSASRPRTTSSCAASRITNRGRSPAHHRVDQLRGGGAGAAGGGCGASGVQQPVRSDGARSRAAGDSLHPPAALRRRSSRRGCCT